MNFRELGLTEKLLEGIDAMGYETATPVQAQVIQPILEGRDIIASAQTGTGKTAAFLLPIIHKMLTQPHSAHHINALIIVPTRELAIQISETMEGLGYLHRYKLYCGIWWRRRKFIYCRKESLKQWGGHGGLHTWQNDCPFKYGLCKNARSKIFGIG